MAGEIVIETSEVISLEELSDLFDLLDDDTNITIVYSNEER